MLFIGLCSQMEVIELEPHCELFLLLPPHLFVIGALAVSFFFVFF